MAEMEDFEEGTLKPIIVSGNFWDIVIYNLERKAKLLEYQSVKLESYTDMNNEAIRFGNISKNPELIEEDRIFLENKALELRKFLQTIKKIAEKDGTSELKIRYKD